MAFRTSLFNKIDFDESFGFWGEDVAFSLKARGFGTLKVFYAKNTLHLRSVINRDSNARRFTKQIISRLRLRNRFPKQIKIFWLLTSYSYIAMWKFKSWQLNKLSNGNMRLRMFVIRIRQQIRSKC